MYGKFNFSFVFNNCKFIFLDNIKREEENRTPDLNWLEEELQDREQYQYLAVVSHIPFSNSRYHPVVRDRFNKLMFDYNVSTVIHGHQHNPILNTSTSLNGDTMITFVPGAIRKRLYVVMDFNHDGITVDARRF